jgi:ASC-1-like (ASCH) protein
MATHFMKLTDLPFEKIRTGAKSIEARLYDEKRRLIELGDRIIFTNRAGDSIAATVVALFRYPTFGAMFADLGPRPFGGDSVHALSEEIHMFYSEEDEIQHTVLGIKLELA